MASRDKAMVTPSVLEWARETLTLSISDASSSLKISESTLLAWEEGEASPSLAALRRLADFYRRPIAIFYLPVPPEDTRPPKDFRRLPANATGVISRRLRLEIRRVELRQSIANELTPQDVPSEFRKFDTATLGDDLDELAAQTRSAIPVTLDEQTRWPNPDVALTAWTNALESCGIFVFQTSDVDVTEMRGLSIHDERSPAILVNGGDSPRGRIFTLFHELGHLLLGSSGLCDLYDVDPDRSQTSRTEVFCNGFAAASLVPREALLTHPVVAGHHRDDDWTDDELMMLAGVFSVSTEVIARRLVTLKQATPDSYLRRRDSFLKAADEYRESLKSRKGGPPYFRRVIKSNGRRFCRLVIDAYQEESITGSDVTEFLGMKLDHLPRIVETLFGTSPDRTRRQ